MSELSRPIKNMEHAWRALAFVFFALICGEAWYVHSLSGQINAARVEKSEALDRHLSDQYTIATMKRVARDCPPSPVPEPAPES